MPVCVLGAATSLGGELCRQLGEDVLPAPFEQDALLDSDSIFRWLLRVQPTAVINTIEYADIEQAESEPDKCFAINAIVVKRVAEACELLRCPFVYASSAHLFGGEPQLRRPYRETDPTTPIGVYAHSKRAGEMYATLSRRHYIVRTGELFSSLAACETGDTLVKRVLQLGQDGSPVRLPSDRYFSPSYTPNVAAAIAFLVEREAEYGVYHAVNSNFTTPYDFAFELFRAAGVDTPLQPFMSVAAHGSRLWPRFAALDTAKYHRCGGPRFPTWQAAIADAVASGHDRLLRTAECQVQ